MDNEEVDMEESEDVDILDTVRTLIEGCEDFVVNQIDHCRQTSAKARKLEISKESERMEGKLKNMSENMTTLENAIKEVKDPNPEKVDEKRKELESVIEESISKRFKAMESSMQQKDMEILHLKTEIRQLKEQYKYKELFTAYVNAGNSIMNEPCDDDDKVTENLVSSILQDQTEMFVTDDAFSLSTTELVSTTPGPSHIHSSAINTEHQITEATSEPHISKIITSIEELPEDLRRGVSNYVKDSPYGTKEKLSKLQVAYIRNHLHNLSTTSRRKPSLVARTLVDHGVRDKIWSNKFVPEGVKNFPTYLVTRVKNELSHIKTQELATLAETQHQRLKINSQ